MDSNCSFLMSVILTIGDEMVKYDELLKSGKKLSKMESVSLKKKLLKCDSKMTDILSLR